MTHGAEHLEGYKRQAGDPALPGAGRPKGSLAKPKVLPQIHVDGMPYTVAKNKKGESVQDYWNKQAPTTLKYLFKRMDMFIVYQEAGQPDPFGAEVFKILSKELVKEIRTKAVKARDVKVADPNEGKSIKAYRSKLSKMRQSLSNDAEFTDVVEEETGNFNPLDSEYSPLSDQEDEF